MSILNINKLTKEYKSNDITTKELNGIKFNVEENEFVAIMGSSGSGKTTLLNILSGIDRATSGTIEVSGKDIAKMNKNELALC